MVLEFIQNNVTFFVFILALTAFLILKRKKLNMQGTFPLLYILMYRTSLGLDRMDRWSKKHPKVFLYLAYLSFAVGIAGAVLVFIFMFWQLGFIVENELTTGGGLVLPIKTEAGLEGAVPVFYVPFWYWIIALFILAVVHEFAHGVIAERFGIRIKSSGFAFLGILLPIIPAAFVEPDEKQLAKKPRWQQISMFGAGSTSNFLFGIFFLLIWLFWLFAAGPFVDSTMEIGDVSFGGVMNESSLAQYNISSGELLAVNGVYEKELMLEELQNLSVNKSMNLTINSSAGLNTYPITTFENPTFPDRGMVGITNLNFEFANKEGFGYLGNFPIHFERVLFYIWFLNIAIGMINLLPIWITDGGQISRTAFGKFFKENRARFFNNVVSFISLALIIFTIWPGLLLNLLNFF